MQGDYVDEIPKFQLEKNKTQQIRCMEDVVRFI